MSSVEKVNQDTEIRRHVMERYGRIAEEFKLEVGLASCCGPADNGGSSCCGPDDTTAMDKVAMMYDTPDVGQLPEEVTGLSLGCGDPVTLASLQPGQTVLDLGAGGGIDCFLAAKQVGESGRVIGVDMTAAMLEKARANKARLGADNVDFRLGEIEHLPVSDASVDVIISNCVINLSVDKPQVFREAYRVLRPGGKLAVSDMVTDGPLPAQVKKSLSAWAGCLAGAWDVDDYVGAIEAAGFVDVEVTPVYLDKQLLDEAVDQLELADSIAEGDETIYKSCFSAKVTARKA
jgi:SAM-dependent methyltransferase